MVESASLDRLVRPIGTAGETGAADGQAQAKGAATDRRGRSPRGPLGGTSEVEYGLVPVRRCFAPSPVPVTATSATDHSGQTPRQMGVRFAPDVC